MVVDNSLLKDTVCTTKVLLRHKHGYTSREDSAALKAGSAAHAALAVYFDPRGSLRQCVNCRTLLGLSEAHPYNDKCRSLVDDCAPVTALDILKQQYAAWSRTNVPPDNRLSYENVSRILGAWFEAHPVDSFPFRVRHVETGFSFVLTDWLTICGRIDMDAEMPDGSLYVVDHKAQPLSEPVLTPDGFRLLGTLEIGSKVIGSDGNTYQVKAIHDRGVQDGFRVRFTDGGETICSLDHLWTVRTQLVGAKFKTVTLREMLTVPWARWRTPLQKPIEFPKRELQVSPYLLGALLGDGHFGNSVIFSGADVTQLSLVKAELPEGEQFKKQAGGNYSWIISGGKTLRAIQKLGLARTRSWTKFIPVDYKYSSVEDRKALLQGLLDTDGNVDQGHITYTTVSETLALDVVELVRSLGGLARYRKRAGTKRQAYIVNMRVNFDDAFRLPRKRDAARYAHARYNRIIDSIEPYAPMQMRCIETTAPDGLYVTNDYILTHNSTGNITPWWLAAFRLDSQFSTYVSGMIEHLGGSKVAGGIVNAIEFSKIPGSNTKCRAHGTPYSECGIQHVVERSQMITVDRSPAQLAQWRRDAIRNARKYRDACEMYPELRDISRAPMEGTFYNACTNCSFKDFCEAGRPMDLIDSMLVVDRWEPFAHSQTGQTSTKEKV